MTEVCNMKQVFSCSDFLNDLWQNNPEAPDTLPGLPSPSEGGSTQLGRERSTDMLNLLGVAEDTDSMSNPFGPFTATSTSQRDPAGIVTTSCTSMIGVRFKKQYRPLAALTAIMQGKALQADIHR